MHVALLPLAKEVVIIMTYLRESKIKSVLDEYCFVIFKPDVWKICDKTGQN